MTSKAVIPKHFFREGVFKRNPQYDEDIKILRDWLKHQPHLPPLSDEHLYMFLHCCYRKMTWTKLTIDNFYTFRTEMPEFFDNRDPLGPDVQSQLNLCNVVPLPRTTPEGYNVIIFRIFDNDASKFNSDAAIKVFGMVNDVQLAEHGLELGRVGILDMKGLTMNHLTKIKISSAMRAGTYAQEGHPVRVKQVHVVNVLPIADKLMAIAKQLVKPALMNLVQLHSRLDSLYKYVPREILPVEYGGEEESCVSIYAREREKIEKEYGTWFKEQDSLKVDESKRIGKKPTRKTLKLHGIEGSFRKLSID